jgi:ribosomal protein S18 acetylase RimI-like enzyme
LDLVHGGRTGFAGFVAREPSNGPLVGYAQLSRGHDTWGVEVVIRPDHRKPDAEVGISLLFAALREVGREGGGHVHLWVPKPTPHTDAMAETCGLRRGRDLYQMRRPLPVDDDHDTEPPLGEIYVISVDPDFQGLGLGRALVLAGLDHLSSRGITVAMLYVDADNVAAVHLYRKLGFEVDHTDRAYVTDMPASS